MNSHRCPGRLNPSRWLAMLVLVTLQFLLVAGANATEVYGYVKNYQGQAVPYVSVDLLRGGTTAAPRVTADQNGKYSFAAVGTSGTYRCKVYHSRGSTASSADFYVNATLSRVPAPQVTVDQSGTLNHRIEGSVKSLSGSPVRDVRVRLTKDPTGFVGGTELGDTTTNSQGMFTLSGLAQASGRYRCLFFAFNGVGAGQVWLPGEIFSVDISKPYTQAPAFSIQVQPQGTPAPTVTPTVTPITSVTVVGDVSSSVTGSGISGATVRITRKSDSREVASAATTTSSGRYEFRAIPTGVDYLVTASKSQYAAGTNRIEPLPGDRNPSRDYDIALDPTGASSPRPLGLYVQGDPGTGSTISDSLPNGSVSAHWFEVEVPYTGTLTFSLTPANTGLGLKVYRDPPPSPGALVGNPHDVTAADLCSPTEPRKWYVQVSASTNTSKSYTIRADLTAPTFAPDVVVTSLKTDTSEYPSTGAFMKPTVALINFGGALTAALPVEFFISTNDTPSLVGDLSVGTATLSGGIQAGDDAVLGTSLGVPPGLTVGMDYYLKVCLDPAGSVAGEVTCNNLGVAAQPFRMRPGTVILPYDLGVLHIVAPLDDSSLPSYYTVMAPGGRINDFIIVPEGARVYPPPTSAVQWDTGGLRIEPSGLIEYDNRGLPFPISNGAITIDASFGGITGVGGATPVLSLDDNYSIKIKYLTIQSYGTYGSLIRGSAWVPTPDGLKAKLEGWLTNPNLFPERESWGYHDLGVEIRPNGLRATGVTVNDPFWGGTVSLDSTKERVTHTGNFKVPWVYWLVAAFTGVGADGLQGQEYTSNFNDSSGISVGLLGCACIYPAAPVCLPGCNFQVTKLSVGIAGASVQNVLTPVLLGQIEAKVGHKKVPSFDPLIWYDVTLLNIEGAGGASRFNPFTGYMEFDAALRLLVVKYNNLTVLPGWPLQRISASYDSQSGRGQFLADGVVSDVVSGLTSFASASFRGAIDGTSNRVSVNATGVWAPDQHWPLVPRTGPIAATLSGNDAEYVLTARLPHYPASAVFDPKLGRFVQNANLSSSIVSNGVLQAGARNVQPVSIPAGKQFAAIRATSLTPMTGMSLRAPTGVLYSAASVLISESNAGPVYFADNGLKPAGAGGHEVHEYVFYLIQNSVGSGIVPGDYILSWAESTSPLVEVFSQDSAPALAIDSPRLDGNLSPVVVSFVASDPDDDAQILLFYDTNREGHDGQLITRDTVTSGTEVIGVGPLPISEDSGQNEYVWNPQDVPSGDYYVYGMISDGKNAPVFSNYAPGRVRIVQPGSPDPPSHLTLTPQSSAINCAWNDNGTTDSQYILLYRRAVEGEEFDRLRADALATEQMTDWTITGLTNGYEYDVAVAAMDPVTGKRSLLEGPKRVSLVSLTANNAPQFTSAPLRQGRAGKPYTYDAHAEDVDGEDLAYELVEAPVGMRIDSATGRITFDPVDGHIGTHRVRVDVHDPRGLGDVQKYILSIDNWLTLNRAPDITTTATLRTAEIGSLFEYDIDAVDPDEDVVMYDLQTTPTLPPAGMTINAGTGVIRWSVTEADAGDHPIRVRAYDGRGGQAFQDIIIRVQYPTLTVASLVASPQGAQIAPAEFTLTAAPSSPFVTSYEWNFGDATSASGPDLRAVRHVFQYPAASFPADATTTVTLTVRGPGNPPATATVGVVLHPPKPVVDFSVDAPGWVRPTPSANVTFTPSVQFATSLSWNFGEGGANVVDPSPFNPNESNSFDSTLGQVYEVTLTATGPSGTAAVVHQMILQPASGTVAPIFHSPDWLAWTVYQGTLSAHALSASTAIDNTGTNLIVTSNNPSGSENAVAVSPLLNPGSSTFRYEFDFDRGGNIVYSDNFEDSVPNADPRWAVGTTSNRVQTTATMLPPANPNPLSSRVLGIQGRNWPCVPLVQGCGGAPPNGEDVRLSLTGLPAHDSMSLEFDLYICGSWDLPDADKLVVSDLTNSVTFLDAVFNQTTGSASPAIGPPIAHQVLGYNATGYGGPTNYNADDLYHVVIQSPHSASNAKLGFASTLHPSGTSLGYPDEAWAMDNLVVRVGSGSDITVPRTAYLIWSPTNYLHVHLFFDGSARRWRVHLIRVGGSNFATSTPIDLLGDPSIVPKVAVDYNGGTLRLLEGSIQRFAISDTPGAGSVRLGLGLIDNASGVRTTRFQSARLLVPNAAPTWNTLPAVNLFSGEVRALDLAAYVFDDLTPDSQLNIRVSSSDGIEVHRETGSTFLQIGAAPDFTGARTLQITATDSDGLSATADLQVVVAPPYIGDPAFTEITGKSGFSALLGATASISLSDTDEDDLSDMIASSGTSTDVFTNLADLTFVRVPLLHAPPPVGGGAPDVRMWIVQGSGVNGVWSSPDGTDWRHDTAAPNFGERHAHTASWFKNQLWLIGGYDLGYKNDVWSSGNGTSWTRVTPSAGFSGRIDHSCEVFSGRMWVIGGNDAAARNDVWSSGDGAMWVQETPAAGFSPRFNHSSLVFNSRLWVIGGEAGGAQQSDVWSSSDGISWTNAATSAPFGPRFVHESVVFHNRMWVIGGLSGSDWKNDVWSSVDGATWVSETLDANFTPRLGFSATVLNDRIWVIGGRTQGGDTNDVWSSPDGVTWAQELSAAPFPPCSEHASVVSGASIQSLSPVPFGSRQALAIDLDNDGDNDLVAASETSLTLMLNDGTGHFVDNTTSSGLSLIAGGGISLAAADINNDGALDIYVLRDGANVVLTNDSVSGGSLHFSDTTGHSGLGGTGDSEAAAFVDVDGDDVLDCYVTNRSGPDSLYVGLGGGVFVLAQSLQTGSRGVAVGDFDGDGAPDLFVTGNGPGRRPSLLINRATNEAGTWLGFADVTSTSASLPLAEWRSAVALDYDNDADLDLLVSRVGGANMLLANDGAANFTAVGQSGVDGALPNTPSATAAADLDGDGDLDVVQGQAGIPPILLRNNCISTSDAAEPTGRNWLHVDLVGTVSNRTAIGTRVELWRNGLPWQTRFVTVGDGWRSQDSTTVEFGLGDQPFVETLLVFWPSGIITVLDSLDANQRIPVIEERRIQYLEVSPSPIVVRPGQTLPLVVTGFYEDGTPTGVDESLCGWSIGVPSIATVTSAGEVVGAEEGRTQLAASLDGVTSLPVEVFVTSAELTTLEVLPGGTTTIGEGEQAGFTALAHFTDLSTTDVTDFAVWTSDREDVAGVGIEGTARGLTAGTAHISAAYQDKEATPATLEVVAQGSSSLRVEPSSVALGLIFDPARQLQAYRDIVTPLSSFDVTSEVEWLVADPFVATVDSSGLIQAAGAGHTTVRAYSGGHSSSAITVDVVQDLTPPTSSGSIVATATNNTGIAIAFTASDSVAGVTSTELFVKTPGAGSFATTGLTRTGTSGTFTYSAVAGDGTYEFYTRATDLATNIEAAPGSADDSIVLDTAAPTSSGNIVANATNSTTIPVAFTASDSTSGVSSTELFVKTPGAGSFVPTGLTLAGTSNTFNYSAVAGDGTYQFYTRATDLATNVEAAPAVADDSVLLDTAAPTSSGSIAATVTNIPTIPVNFSASDADSGTSSTELFVKTPGAGSFVSTGLTLAGTSNTFNYSAVAGDGTYQFYTRATDLASNLEAAPGSADDSVVLDTGAPTSSGNIVATATNTTSIPVAFTASDSTSGVFSTELFVKTPGAGSFVSTGLTLAGTSNTFNYSAVAGDGTYQFYTRATDLASNLEAAPGSADDSVVLDSAAPTSSGSIVAAVTNNTAIPVAFTAADSGSGVSSTELFVKTPGAGSFASTTLTLTGALGTFSYPAVAGDGTYQFYTRATDLATNVEAAPGVADDSIVLDTAAPTSSGSIVAAVTNNTAIPVAFTAADSGSGVSSTELFVKTPGAGSFASTTLTLTGASGTFSYPAVAGDGTYQFHTRATDLASNLEAAPGAADDSILLDTAAPTSVATLSDPTRVGSAIGSIASDDGIGSGVASVALWVKGPSAGWESAGSGFPYTPSGDGLYRFASVATDAAGNAEAPPAGVDLGDGFAYINDVANSTFTLPVVSNGTFPFPMTDALDVLITFTGGATGGPVTVSRTVGDVSEAGLGAAKLIDESLTITGDFTTTATISWSIDPASDDMLPRAFDTVFKVNEGVVSGQFPVAEGVSPILVGPVSSFSNFYAGNNDARLEDWTLLDP